MLGCRASGLSVKKSTRALGLYVKSRDFYADYQGVVLLISKYSEVDTALSRFSCFDVKRVADTTYTVLGVNATLNFQRPHKTLIEVLWNPKP